MKSKKEHIEADLYLLGYTNPFVHIFIDAAAKWMGAGHRSIKHSSKVIEAVELIAGKEGRKIALLHLLIDNRIVNTEQIQAMIKKDKSNKKKQKKKTSQGN